MNQFFLLFKKLSRDNCSDVCFLFVHFSNKVMFTWKSLPVWEMGKNRNDEDVNSAITTQ